MQEITNEEKTKWEKCVISVMLSSLDTCKKGKYRKIKIWDLKIRGIVLHDVMKYVFQGRGMQGAQDIPVFTNLALTKSLPPPPPQSNPKFLFNISDFFNVVDLSNNCKLLLYCINFGRLLLLSFILSGINRD